MLNHGFQVPAREEGPRRGQLRLSSEREDRGGDRRQNQRLRPESPRREQATSSHRDRDEWRDHCATREADGALHLLLRGLKPPTAAAAAATNTNTNTATYTNTATATNTATNTTIATNPPPPPTPTPRHPLLGPVYRQLLVGQPWRRDHRRAAPPWICGHLLAPARLGLPIYPPADQGRRGRGELKRR